MLDANQIQMNFEKAKLDAQNLDDLATRIDNLAQGKLEDTLDRLSGAWKGDNADLFINKSRQVQTDMKKAAETLRKGVAQIRKTAEETYKTEMRNYEIAQKRMAEVANIVNSVANHFPRK